MLSRSFLTSIFNITCCTHSSGALAYGFLIVLKTGLISKSFSKVFKSRLNSYHLSNITWRGRGYLHIHVLLNSWITLVDDLSMYLSLPVVTSSSSYIGISKISNHPVAGSIIFLQVRPTLFLIMVPPVFCYLIELLYEISGTHASNITFLALPLS